MAGYNGRSGSGRGGYPKPVSGARRGGGGRQPSAAQQVVNSQRQTRLAQGMGPHRAANAWRDAAAAQSVIDTQNKTFLRAALRAQQQGAAPDGGSGGGGGGYGGGGYGGPSAAAINTDYQNQVNQVNQIGADQAAKLKAIQDAYNAQAQAAVAGIRNDTAQLQGQFSGEMANLKRDLSGQAVQANPVLAQGVVQGQSLADAQNRTSAFAQQLALAQNANFADRAAGAATAQQGYLTDLAMQKAAALSGGSGGGGGGGYGGGGSGSDMPDYLKTKNLNSDLILGSKLAGEESTYRDWLRQQGHGAFKGMPIMQGTLKALRGGMAPDSLLARTSPNHKRVVGFLKQASKQYGGKRKAGPKRQLRAAQRAKANY